MHHKVRHFKGGFYIDESTLDDNSNYWRMSAEGALSALLRLVKDEAYDLLEGVWNENKTWKEICLETENILEKAEHAAEHADWLDAKRTEEDARR